MAIPAAIACATLGTALLSLWALAAANALLLGMRLGILWPMAAGSLLSFAAAGWLLSF